MSLRRRRRRRRRRLLLFSVGLRRWSPASSLSLFFPIKIGFAVNGIWIVLGNEYENKENMSLEGWSLSSLFCAGKIRVLSLSFTHTHTHIHLTKPFKHKRAHTRTCALLQLTGDERFLCKMNYSLLGILFLLAGCSGPFGSIDVWAHLWSIASNTCGTGPYL